MHAERNFKPSHHCAAQRARATPFLVDRTPTIFVPFYCSPVRPHPQYVIQVTCPYPKKEVDYEEKIQRLETRKVKSLKDLPHAERLSKLGLHTLE